MKKLVFYLMLLVCYSVYSQKTDTIMYSDIECNEPMGNSETQSVSIQLKSDTLTLSGKIIANCCGTHFLKYEVLEDSIYFTRIDTGNLCDCYCLHDISIKISECTSSLYNIKLLEYSGNDGIDTLINATSISNNYSINKSNPILYPNPSQGTVYIHNSFNVKKLSIFNSKGELIRSQSHINSNKIELQNSGIYIARFYLNNGTVASKKFIIY